MLGLVINRGQRKLVCSTIRETLPSQACPENRLGAELLPRGSWDSAWAESEGMSPSRSGSNTAQSSMERRSPNPSCAPVSCPLSQNAPHQVVQGQSTRRRQEGLCHLAQKQEKEPGGGFPPCLQMKKTDKTKAIIANPFPSP